MFTVLNEDAYPILDGKALVKVNLRKRETQHSIFNIHMIIQKIKLAFVRLDTGRYFLNPFAESIPIVVLSRTANMNQRCCSKTYEHNLLKDVISPWLKFKLMASSITAAGLLILSAVALTENGDLSKNYSVNKISGSRVENGDHVHINGKNKQDTFVISLTERENVVMASLSNPMDKVFMRKDDKHTNTFSGTHVNTGGTHTNIPGDNTHVDIGPTNPDDPNTGHKNLGGEHINTSHSNYVGHNNGVEHTNVYDSTNE